MTGKPGTVDKYKGILRKLFPALADVTEEEIDKAMDEERRKG